MLKTNPEKTQTITDEIYLKIAELDKARVAAATKADAQERHDDAIAAKQRLRDEIDAAITVMRADAPAYQRDAITALRLSEDREEELLAPLTVVEAANLLEDHRRDPFDHSGKQAARAERLRKSVRDEFNTPVNKKYTVHPLVAQALALVPPPPEMERQRAQFTFDWPMRRKAAITALCEELGFSTTGAFQHEQLNQFDLT